MGILIVDIPQRFQISNSICQVSFAIGNHVKMVIVILLALVTINEIIDKPHCANLKPEKYRKRGKAVGEDYRQASRPQQKAKEGK